MTYTCPRHNKALESIGFQGKYNPRDGKYYEFELGDCPVCGSTLQAGPMIEKPVPPEWAAVFQKASVK